MELTDALLNSLLFAVPLVHLYIAPHTKVEESFNIQAAHDILVYGTPTRDAGDRLAIAYDHLSFPGAVPRSFVGAVVVSGLSQPLVLLAGFRHAQLLVRAVLAVFNAGCLVAFRNALSSAFGRPVARWWTLLLVSQFHIMYYLSRTLPNMFAFGLTTLAFAFVLPKSTKSKAIRRRKQAIMLLTFSAVVFRSELAILLAAMGLYLVLSGRTTVRALFSPFLVFFVLSLAISVPIDSYFWQRWLWPELAGFYYNVVLGFSTAWGVSPWHYYFTSALPRLLANPLAPLLALGALVHPGTSMQARQLVIPSLIFVAVYSFQPHKEARFIFYVVPPLTAAAALGADFVASRRSRSLLYRLATFAVAASVPGTLLISTAMLLISSLNYPGGDALVQLRSLVGSSALADPDAVQAVNAHADVLTCMTGLTLFGQNPHGLPLAYYIPGSALPPLTDATPSFIVDKTENKLRLDWSLFWADFEYVFTEDPAEPLGSWQQLGVVQGFDGFEILRPGQGSRQDEEMQLADEIPGEDNVMGLGAMVGNLRETIRRYTGGWWIGPRMSPRIRIMGRQV